MTHDIDEAVYLADRVVAISKSPGVVTEIVDITLARPRDPDPDAVLAALAAHIEGGKRADDPFLERCHIGADIGPAPLQVEQHIGHALAGTVIGDLPAAPAREQRKAGLQKVVCLAGGAGGVERGMLQQPDELRGLAGGDRSGARFHRGHRLEVIDRLLRNPPFDALAG